MDFLQFLSTCVQMLILGIGLVILIVVPSIMAGAGFGPLAGILVFILLIGNARVWGGLEKR